MAHDAAVGVLEGARESRSAGSVGRGYCIVQYLNSDVHFGAELQQYVVENSAEAKYNNKLVCFVLLISDRAYP